MTNEAMFGYRLSRTEAGWAWKTFDSRGQVDAVGEAPDRVSAAACVIRMIAERAIEEAQQAA